MSNLSLLNNTCFRLSYLEIKRNFVGQLEKILYNEKDFPTFQA